jgi:hypothetical protein
MRDLKAETLDRALRSHWQVILTYIAEHPQISRAIARAELPGADDFARESLASDLRRCAEILARHA